MDRQVLIEKYQQIFEQAQERNAEWYVCRDVLPLLASALSLSAVHAELVKLRKQCEAHAKSDAPDAVYGTYGDYMRFKIALFNQVLKELGHPNTSGDQRPDLIGTL